MTLAHIALWTVDLDQAVIFWRTYFNAEAGEAYHSTRRPGFVSRLVTLPGGHLTLELMSGPWVAPARDAEHAGWAHIAIQLDNRTRVDAAALRFEQDGLLVSGPRMTGDGFYEAVIRTPDGALIELTA